MTYSNEEPVNLTNSSDNSSEIPDDSQDMKDSNGWRGFLTLGNYLETEGWNPQRLEEAQAYQIYFRYTDDSEKIGIAYAQIIIDLQQFVFYIPSPFKIPEELRPKVAEYITRANYGLRVGNLEMDYEDGEVRYKSCVDFEGEILTDGYIKNTMNQALKSMDHYLPGLYTIVNEGKTPLEAIEQVEAD
jgi:hypothetical protein